MKRFLVSVVFLLIAFSCFSQDLNSYKYVIVPYEFSFLNGHDKFRVNTLTRHLFREEGFEVLYDNEEFPKDLADDRCLALYMDINDSSGMFSTKLSIVLSDCSNQIVMETEEGHSRIKAYGKAYNEAFRSAFAEIEAKNYSYTPKVKTIKETPIVVVETPIEVVETPIEVVENVKITVVEEKTPIDKTVVQNGTLKTVTETTEAVLYAQPIKNGYQLVDSTPKVIMILLKSGAPNVYIVKGQDASVYKENGKWILSKVTSEGNETSVLNVKF